MINYEQYMTAIKNKKPIFVYCFFNKQKNIK